MTISLSDDVRVPDVLGTAVGYRLFQISSADLLLRSLVFSGVSWERGENSARCLFSGDLVVAGDRGGHSCVWSRQDSQGQIPGVNCGCGLYASFDPPQVRAEYWPRSQVVVVSGVVEAWGRILVGRLGFRAHHARVVGLSLEGRVPERLTVAAVAEHYGVPLYESDAVMLANHPLSSHLADLDATSHWGGK